MSTAADAALDTALDASFGMFGEAVTVDGDAATGVITGAGFNTVFVPGGTGESLGKSLTLKKDDFPTAPEKGALCVVRGQTLQVLTVFDRLRHWRCELGDISTRNA